MSVIGWIILISCIIVLVFIVSCKVASEDYLDKLIPYMVSFIAVCFIVVIVDGLRYKYFEFGYVHDSKYCVCPDYTIHKYDESKNSYCGKTNYVEYDSLSLVDFLSRKWGYSVYTDNTESIDIAGNSVSITVNDKYACINVDNTLYKVKKDIVIDSTKNYKLYYDGGSKSKIIINNIKYDFYNACFIEEVN